MQLLFEKEIFGSNSNIFVPNQETILFNSTDNNNVTLTINNKSLYELSKLFLFKIPELIPQEYVEAYKSLTLNKQTNHVPWQSCIPKEKYEAHVKKTITKLYKTLSNIKTLNYYTETFIKTNKVFNYLQPLLFEGKEQRLTYDRLESVTGRLRQVSGNPNLLILKKEKRASVHSNFGNNGTILLLDYCSLEPRVALSFKQLQDTETMASQPTKQPRPPLYAHTKPTVNKSMQDYFPQDIYQHFKETVFQEQVTLTRDIIKIIVLSELFGASEKNIKNELKEYNLRDVDSIVKRIEEEFGLAELKDYILKIYKNNDKNFIDNLYGKRLDVSNTMPYKFPNFFIQSTAVDVALFGFLNMVEYLDSINKLDVIRPIFLLHDAIGFDCHNDFLYLLQTLKKIGSQDIPKFENITFYLKIKNLLD